MDDENIYKELTDDSSIVVNKYEQNWGSLLNFLDDSKLGEDAIMQEIFTNAQKDRKFTKNVDLVDEQNDFFLKQHDITDEISSFKRNRNMADVMDKLSNVPGRSSMVKSYTADQTTSPPEPDYVYRPKKKAVIYIRKKGNNTQIKGGDGKLDSSFYSQGDAPVNMSAHMSTKGENFGIGYKALSGTPLQTTSKAQLNISRAPKSAKRKNITGKGDPISVFNQKPKNTKEDEENQNLIMSDQAIKENHLLRSIYKLKQQDDKTAASRVGVGDGKNENFTRMTTQLSHIRKRFGARSTNNRPDSKDQKFMNQLYPKHNKPELQGDLKAQFGGVTPALLLTNHKNENWMKKRRMLAKTETNRKHIEFAKNLFISWDEEGGGVLKSNKIVKPLISMGLSSDSRFATKLLHSLDTSKKRKVGDMKITMLDFIKIFKSDKLSEQISNIISNEIQEDNLAKISINHTKQFAGTVTEPLASKIGTHNATISMKISDNAIVEVPINNAKSKFD